MTDFYFLSASKMLRYCWTLEDFKLNVGSVQDVTAEHLSQQLLLCFHKKVGKTDDGELKNHRSSKNSERVCSCVCFCAVIPRRGDNNQLNLTIFRVNRGICSWLIRCKISPNHHPSASMLVTTAAHTQCHSEVPPFWRPWGPFEFTHKN